MTELTRSPELYDNSKPKRSLKKNQIPADTGNTSANPGTWLTVAIENGPNLDGRCLDENYESAIEIADSFLLRTRFRFLKHPMGPHPQPNEWHDKTNYRPDPPANVFITDASPTLENKATCFGVAVRPQAAACPNFRIMEQDHVLSGPALRAYVGSRETLVSYSLMVGSEEAEEEDGLDELEPDFGNEEHEFGLSKFEQDLDYGEDEPNGNQLGEETGPRIVMPRVKVSDVKLNADYSTWCEIPTAENESSLYDSLSRFVLFGKVPLVYRGDTISKRDAAEELGQDFVISMMEKLKEQRGNNLIKNLARYVSRAWTYTKWDRNKAVAESDRRNPGLSVRGIDEDVDGGAEDVCGISQIDKSAFAEWKQAQRSDSVVQESEDEYFDRCQRMLASIEDESLRDLAGLWIKMNTGKKIASRLGISTQKVDRDKKKIRGIIRTLQTTGGQE